jgi:hypothetical protein
VTRLVTLPETSIPAGPGAITSGAIASNLSRFVATMLQVSWPLAGDKAIDYQIEQSNDGGASWDLLSWGDMSDVANPLLTIRFGCTLRDVGQSGRRVRLSWNFAKPLTISGTLDAT